MLHIETLNNGLTVIVEEIAHLESAAYELLLPGGIVSDPEDLQGACLVLAELTSRGAGQMDSRALSEAYESLGIRHAESAEHERYSYRGALLAENLEKALELTALMLREPSFPADQLDNIRSSLLQELASLVDHPAQRAMIELSARYYPKPFSRSSLGSEAGLRALDISKLKQLWQRQFAPKGAVLSVAGKVKTASVMELSRKYFQDWQGAGQARPAFAAMPERASFHIPFDSAQLQIVMAYPSELFAGKHYYDAKVATGVLSGGMFGKLFIEVREKRGLCYSVNARHSSNKDYGTIVVYAGTTPQRAHETLAVIVKELRGLAGNISSEELARAKANLLSAVIIGEESSSSRASSNASDWWVSGKVRTLDQIQAGIDAVTLESLDQYLRLYPADSFSTLTLGSRELQVAEVLQEGR